VSLRVRLRHGVDCRIYDALLHKPREAQSRSCLPGALVTIPRSHSVSLGSLIQQGCPKRGLFFGSKSGAQRCETTDPSMENEDEEDCSRYGRLSGALRTCPCAGQWQSVEAATAAEPSCTPATSAADSAIAPQQAGHQRGPDAPEQGWLRRKAR